MYDLDFTSVFSEEELALMRAFDGSSCATLLGDLYQSLPDVYQPDTKRAMRSAIGKLAAMTDAEFEAQGFDADCYAYYIGEEYE